MSRSSNVFALKLSLERNFVASSTVAREHKDFGPVFMLSVAASPGRSCNLDHSISTCTVNQSQNKIKYYFVGTLFGRQGTSSTFFVPTITSPLGRRKYTKRLYFDKSLRFSSKLSVKLATLEA